jgi:uncharacterized protein YlxW (UPF0749 family)
MRDCWYECAELRRQEEELRRRARDAEEKANALRNEIKALRDALKPFAEKNLASQIALPDMLLAAKVYSESGKI